MHTCPFHSLWCDYPNCVSWIVKLLSSSISNSFSGPNILLSIQLSKKSQPTFYTEESNQQKFSFVYISIITLLR
jgi:hypothetical protein